MADDPTNFLLCIIYNVNWYGVRLAITPHSHLHNMAWEVKHEKKDVSSSIGYPTQGDILVDQSFQWFKINLQNVAPISNHETLLNAV